MPTFDAPPTPSAVQPPSSDELLAGLNDAQRAAARAVSGPVVILAGAGTGKTRTITHRIANQVATGVAPADAILAVTFTDRAARELRERLAGLGLPAPIRAATFHSAAWAQLRYFWHRAHDRPLPEVLGSKLRIVGPLARRHGVQERDVAAEIEWAKARRLTPEAYAAAAADRDAPLEPDEMAQLYAAYERRKDEGGFLDYDDMLLKTTTLIDSDPAIAEEVRSRYRFFTVDEYQDVNPAQHALLRAWLGASDELCVVGDDDQTIYRFTGATPEYLTGFAREFPGATRITLTESYRSTDEVIALANEVLWTKPKAARKRLVGRQGSGPAPTFTGYDDAEAEVAGVVDRIGALRADGVPAGEIAICYRVNSQSEPFEKALADARIPYVVRGEGGFFERREIRQALALLQTAAQEQAHRPEDPASLGTLANPKPADRLVEQALREQGGWNPKVEPSGEAARDRWRNLGALHALCERLVAQRPGLSLADVVTELTDRAAAGHEAPDVDGAVTLLTLHRAKGLEFDAVFLISLEEGLLPLSHAKTDDEVEEERRLLYVGVTRARRHLALSWSESRVGRSGRASSRTPSRLLYNLSPDAPRSAPSRKAKKASARTCACGRPLISAADRKARRCAACAGGTTVDGPVDPVLAQALRDWRRDRSASDAVPAFVVFNDATLRALATGRPRTPEELLGIRGFGPAKLERYGEDVLGIIRSHG